MIQITDLLDQTTSINPHLVLRLRQSDGPSEPMGATMIELDGKRIFASVDAGALAKAIAEVVPLTQLTTPNRLHIWIATSRVLDVRPPNSESNPAAGAIVAIQRSGKLIEQQVREDVAAVKAAMTA